MGLFDIIPGDGDDDARFTEVDPPLFEREELSRLFHEANHSITSVANHTGQPRDAVWFWGRRYGLVPEYASHGLNHEPERVRREQGSQYSRDEILSSVTHYYMYHGEITTESLDQNKAYPSYGAVMRHFETWADVLEEVGITSKASSRSPTDSEPLMNPDCTSCGENNWLPNGVGEITLNGSEDILDVDIETNPDAAIDAYFYCATCGALMVREVQFDKIQDERERIN